VKSHAHCQLLNGEGGGEGIHSCGLHLMSGSTWGGVFSTAVGVCAEVLEPTSVFSRRLLAMWLATIAWLTASRRCCSRIFNPPPPPKKKNQKYKHIYTCTYTHTHTHTHTHIKYVYIYIYISIYTSIPIPMHMHICINTHTFTSNLHTTLTPDIECVHIHTHVH